MVRFVVISDTHSCELTDKDKPVSVPQGDVLLHCGDFTRVGAPNEIKAFCTWFANQPHERKILIAGNHDLSLQKDGYANRAAAHRTKIRGGAGEADNVSD